MKLKILISGAAFLAVILAVAYQFLSPDNDPPSPPEPNQKPNVIIVVSDALRQDVLGCYGGEALTPNIDRLAVQGVLFENAYSPCPWTAPSSVSMFTGNHASSYDCSSPTQPKRASTTTIYVPHSELLLAERLQEEGYHTGRVVENVNASIHNNLQGLTPINNPKYSKQLADTLELITGNRSERNVAFMQASIFLGYLLNRTPGEPFFAMHWMLDPHYPYEPPAKYKDRIDMTNISLRRPANYYMNGVRHPKWLTEDEIRYYHKLYIAEVESVDERIGNLLKVLAAKNLLGSTYIVFTSDHGEQFGQHGLHGHGGLGRGCHYYEGLVRIPLIIHGPDLPAGRRIKTNVCTIGLMPTLRELLGIEYKHNMQGQSFAALLRGEARDERPVYLDDVVENDQTDALIAGQYKLITLAAGGTELYDLSIDPEENTNLSLNRPDQVKALFDIIQGIRQENNLRKARNIAQAEDHTSDLTEEERAKINKKLKSLGYIK